LPFVLDASVTLTWLMQDESHPLADLAFAQLRQDYAIAPAIWWYEVRNMLVVNSLRGRITIPDSAQALLDLNRMPIRVGAIGSHGNLTDLAHRFKITVYDGAYLDIAIRRGQPLATLDKALRRAAESAGVPLLT
jgi:predicted nucleic acid-binding protein